MEPESGRKRKRRRTSSAHSGTFATQIELEDRDRKIAVYLRVLRSFFLFFAYIATLIYIMSIPLEKAIVVDDVGSVSRAIGIPLLGLWVIVLVFNPFYRRINSFFIVAACFVMWVGLTRFWAESVETVDFFLVTYVQLLLSSLCIWLALDQESKCKTALQVFLIGAWVVIFVIFYNFHTGNLEGNRATIASSDQNEIALMLAMCLSVAMFLATNRSGRSRPNFIIKLVNLVFVPCALMAIIMTGSRGGTLAAVPALMFLLFNFGKANIGTKSILGLMIVIGAVVLVQNLPEEQFDRIASTQEEIESGDISGRGDLWSDAYEFWAADVETMIGGIGSGNFIDVTQTLVHNTHLSVLTETGLVGFSIYLFMLLILFFAIRRSGDGHVKAFLYSFLLSWFVGATALTWEYRKPTWLAWSLIICIAVAFRKKPIRKQPASSGNKRRRRKVQS